MELLLFSGYIRNWNALREELGSPETDDRTALEKEILLRGFERWGQSLCSHLYGAFSYVIRDPATGALYCARDPFGVSTFFYHLTPSGKLLFSEDIREIARHPDYKKAPDPHALHTYLTLGYPAGTDTLFAGIQKLSAGHRLVYQGGRLTIERYYHLRYDPDHARSEADWVEEIAHTARTILSEDRSAPGFSGAESFLSGGVDSSYLLALSHIPTACSIGYDGGDLDESQLARQTAELLGRDFRKCTVSPEQYFRTVPKVVSAMGLPLADMSSVAFFLGCEDVAKRASVCFSGEGADEFFAGYRLYRNGEKLARDDSPLHLGCSGVMESKYADDLLLEKDPQFSCVPLVEEIYKETAHSEHLARLLSIDVRLYLEGDILFGLNRSSAAHGLQVRTPFADQRMFELAARIPSDLKLHDGIGKYILRRAAEQALPHDVAFREKVGFSVPISRWMRQDGIREEMEKTLFGDASRKIFRQDLLKRYWTNFQNGSDGIRSVIFAVYVFLIWYEMWF